MNVLGQTIACCFFQQMYIEDEDEDDLLPLCQFN